MKFKIKNHFALALFLLSMSSFAQVKLGNGITYKIHAAPDKKVNYYVQDAGKMTKDTTYGRFIVKFRSDPETRAMTGRKNSNWALEHRQFTNDLTRIEGANRQRNGFRDTKVHHHFTRVFNGKAVSASMAVVDEIRKLPYVHYVIEDKRIKVSDENSNAIIEADKVWSQLNSTGKGVVIGIIDTGIDYNHPDISDGIGPGHKVLGGYDFVNNDNDPMDDHGHGTHVSGIAAANGPNLRGVAPDANLMGFKVLTADGWGYNSWILAGIERCLDPDQNPATDDKVDVVNMSLGGYTDGPDPLSEAVDNAVAAGIVFAIAAGNDGYSGYESIDSPGISPNAITVGATDSNDLLADFSSKGPAPGSFALKPDLVAPGVDIRSALPNGKYASWSGTSMATPHVTGAVALLLQLHPEWTPVQIKSVLMQNSAPVNGGIFDVGAGRLDILSAAKASFSISPSSVSLGALDKSQPIYTTTIPLTVSNFSGQAKAFNLSASGDLNFPGVTTTIDQSSFTLDGNASQVVNVMVSIQTSLIPIRDLPDLYLGAINISDNVTSYKVPVGFVNPERITLHFDQPLPNLVAVFGTDSYFFKFYFPTAENFDIVLQTGDYNFVAIYQNRYVVKENISIPELTDLSISKADATNLLAFQPVDEKGGKIPLRDDMFGLAGISYVQPGSSGFFSLTLGAMDTLYTSNLSEKWNIGFKVFDNVTMGSPKFYNLGATENGVSQSKVFTNSPSDLVTVKYQYDHDPALPVDVSTIFEVWFGGGALSTFKTIPGVPSDFVEFQQKVDTDGPVISSQYQILAYGNSGYNFQTPGLSIYKNDSVAFHKTVFPELNESLKLLTPFLNIKLNETLLQWSAGTANTDTTVVVMPFVYDDYFVNNRGDKVLGKVNYTLSNTSGIVKSNSVVNPSQWGANEYIRCINLSPDTYTLKIDFEDYQVEGRYGKASTELHFKTDLDDKNPPFLTRLQLSSDGKFANHFSQGDPISLSVEVSDYCNCAGLFSDVASYKVELKKLDDVNWTSLPSGSTISIPSNLDAGLYSLRVSALDNAGNNFTYTLEPAFLVGLNPDPVPFQKPLLLFPTNRSSRIPQNTLFAWKVVIGVASYNLQVSTDSTFSTTIQDSSLTNDSVRFSTAFDSNTKYYWRVQGNYGNNNLGAWSNIFSFTTGNGVTSSVILIAPTNNSELDAEPTFIWTEAPEATSYQWQLVVSQNSQDIIYDDRTVSDSSIQSTVLPGSEWHWRVRPNYLNMDGEWSAYFHFSTGLPAITALTPVNSAVNVPPNVLLNWNETFSGGNYHILVSTSPDLSNPVFDQIVNYKPYALSLHDSTTYYWKVDVIYQNLLASSSIWSFQTKLPDPVLTLVSPTDNAVDQSLSLTFTWQPLPAGTDYKFALSTNQDFSNPISSTVQSTNVVISNLLPSTEYFWKVGVDYLGSDYWSSQYSFRTVRITGVEEDKSTKLYPNPASAIVNFELEFPHHEVTVINSLGEQVWMHEGSETSFAWNLTNVVSGIYIAQITEGSKTLNKKIVVCR